MSKEIIKLKTNMFQSDDYMLEEYTIKLKDLILSFTCDHESPEDNTLGRNFKEVGKIRDLVLTANKLGLDGYQVILTPTTNKDLDVEEL